MFSHFMLSKIYRSEGVKYKYLFHIRALVTRLSEIGHIPAMCFDI